MCTEHAGIAISVKLNSLGWIKLYFYHTFSMYSCGVFYTNSSSVKYNCIWCRLCKTFPGVVRFVTSSWYPIPGQCKLIHSKCMSFSCRRDVGYCLWVDMFAYQMLILKSLSRKPIKVRRIAKSTKHVGVLRRLSNPVNCYTETMNINAKSFTWWIWYCNTTTTKIYLSKCDQA